MNRVQFLAAHLRQWWHYGDSYDDLDAAATIAELERDGYRWRIVNDAGRTLATNCPAHLDPEPAPEQPEPFQLQAPPARPRPVTFENNQAKQAKRLFAGADCLPGQIDLFNPNGPKEK